MSREVLGSTIGRPAKELARLCEGSRNGREMVIAKLDFTIPNKKRMASSAEVRFFHARMRDFWRLVERTLRVKRHEYGIARCDEIGGTNTNLHAHGSYVGPRLPQKRKELSALWSVVWIPDRIRRKELMRYAREHGLGKLWNQLEYHKRRFVSIKLAKSFAGALAHALKYPAKFLDKSTPERLAALEKTFHRTRRVSTGGAFYRVMAVREPGDDTQLEHQFCPFCRVRLVAVHEQWQPMSTLQEEGRISFTSNTSFLVTSTSHFDLWPADSLPLWRQRTTVGCRRKPRHARFSRTRKPSDAALKRFMTSLDRNPTRRC